MSQQTNEFKEMIQDVKQTVAILKEYQEVAKHHYPVFGIVEEFKVGNDFDQVSFILGKRDENKYSLITTLGYDPDFVGIYKEGRVKDVKIKEFFKEQSQTTLDIKEYLEYVKENTKYTFPVDDELHYYDKEGYLIYVRYLKHTKAQRVDTCIYRKCDKVKGE